MYTCKSAVMNGEITLSDTIGQYRNEVARSFAVPLYLTTHETIKV